VQATWSHAPSELAGTITLAARREEHQHFGLAPTSRNGPPFSSWSGIKAGMTTSAEWCYDLVTFGELASNR
jgi:hypothetical protein